MTITFDKRICPTEPCFFAFWVLIIYWQTNSAAASFSRNVAGSKRRQKYRSRGSEGPSFSDQRNKVQMGVGKIQNKNTQCGWAASGTVAGWDVRQHTTKPHGGQERRLKYTDIMRRDGGQVHRRWRQPDTGADNLKWKEETAHTKPCQLLHRVLPTQ